MGSADSRLGDGGGSSAKFKFVVDSDNLGRLRDEEDEQGGGARKCRLFGCRPAESVEQLECAGLMVQV